MNVDDIKQLLDLVREHDLAEFELEHEGLKLRVKKASDVVVTHAAPAPQPAAAPAPPPVPLAAVPSAAAAAAAEDAGVELAMVKSPIVGTFYRAPEPGARNFAEIGDTVRKGQVLCIIEAMKLMNEIVSDFDGVIEKAYVENGQAVQFNDRLFAIRKG